MKPDWNFLEISNKSRHDCSWLKTTFFKSFGRKGDSEMGMELKRKEESKLLYVSRLYYSMSKSSQDTARYQGGVNQVNNTWPKGIKNIFNDGVGC